MGLNKALQLLRIRVASKGFYFLLTKLSSKRKEEEIEFKINKKVNMKKKNKRLIINKNKNEFILSDLKKIIRI